MKYSSLKLTRALAAAAALTLIAGVCAAASDTARPSYGPVAQSSSSADAGKKQDASKGKAPQASEGERKAAMKINEAPDAAAKLAAAGEFIKKYPKSALRPQVAGYVAGQINAVQDAAQRITLAESFQTQFTSPGEADSLTPPLIETYVAANRMDDAFRVGAAWLVKNPEDVGVLTTLAHNGIEQAKKNNPKFIEQGQKYGLQAVELIEADKKPAGTTDEQWNQYKNFWLPQLYQSLGLVALV
ncbi:MAG: hypothetical protein ACRD68_16265, partial [Pyrinomonadaceae bacterium]